MTQLKVAATQMACGFDRQANLSAAEKIDQSALTFHGSSFVTDNKGALLVRGDRQSAGVVAADLDLGADAAGPAACGLFRDRRPAMYRTIATLDGKS